LAIDLRPTQALGLWHAATLAQLELVGPDITIRQLGILLHIYLAPPPHTVRGLAAKLGVTKPVITRALDTMGNRGLVRRVRDERDRRNVIIKRTVEGALFVQKFGDIVIQVAANLPRDGVIE